DDAHWGVVSAYADPLSTGIWPVFRRRSGFLGPALIPDAAALKRWIETTSASDHQTSLDVAWFRRHRAELRSYLSRETDTAFRTRIKQDLERSLADCHGWHDGDTHALVWPWGSTGPASDAAACDAGYNLAFLTATGANVPGTDPRHAYRFPVKKPDLFRFALGVWMRESPWLARLYGLLRGTV
ncbi:MAG TPA: hypothetical protein PKO06_24305, partial [Candidatus Ozemobacteraceae bacterium]|nr:hypothetical protein [Candidatus Ozemobacteraceae bacterium]